MPLMKNLHRYLIALLFTGIVFSGISQNLEYERTYRGSAMSDDYRISSRGYLYISGGFWGDSIAIGNQTLYTSTPDMRNLFIAKLDTLGECIWAKLLYADSLPDPTNTRIAIDTSENIYLTAVFRDSIDIDPGPGTTTLEPLPGGRSKLVAKFDSDGFFQWAFALNDSGNTISSFIEVDKDQHVILAGTQTAETDFDPSPGVHLLNPTPPNPQYDFLAKYDANGQYMWAYSFRASYGGTVGMMSLKVDHDNNILLTGMIMETIDFDFHPVNTHQLTSNGSWDHFLAKYNPNGGLIFAHSIGGWHNEMGMTIGIDSLNNIYVTGMFNTTGGVDLNPSPNYSTVLIPEGTHDVFFAKYAAEGHLIFARSFGTHMIDFISMDVDPNGVCYWTFRYWGTGWDCDLSDSTVLVSYAPGAGDDLVMITDPQGRVKYRFMTGTQTTDHPMGLILRCKNSFFLYGTLNTGGLDFDPSPINVVNPIFYGNQNIHLAKYHFNYPELTGSDPELPADPWTPFDPDPVDPDDPGNPDPEDPGMPTSPNVDWPPTIFDPATSGLQTLTLFPGVSIFPNPASESFTITGLTETTKISVYDLTGKRLLTTSADIQLTIDATQFAEGVYSLVLEQNGRSGMIRLMVK